jgi:hypothetical protein
MVTRRTSRFRKGAARGDRGPGAWLAQGSSSRCHDTHPTRLAPAAAALRTPPAPTGHARPRLGLAALATRPVGPRSQSRTQTGGPSRAQNAQLGHTHSGTLAGAAARGTLAAPAARACGASAAGWAAAVASSVRRKARVRRRGARERSAGAGGRSAHKSSRHDWPPPGWPPARGWAGADGACAVESPSPVGQEVAVRRPVSVMKSGTPLTLELACASRGKEPVLRARAR